MLRDWVYDFFVSGASGLEHKKVFLLTFLLCFLTSCARVPYVFRPPPEVSASPAEDFTQDNPQISRGERYAVMDEVSSWTFGLFTKLLLWSIKVDNHKISPETEQAIRVYLEKNNLANVKVRLNEYAPLDEWSRLFNNESVGAGWRYTVGMITTLFYTLLPGRIFGGDAYNPFTDSIYLYSDHPAVALHEGGHAKDFADTKWKGTYAALGILPLTSLYSESEATGDAIGYLREEKQRKEEVGAYKTLYPAYATYIGGEMVNLTSFFTPVSSAVALAAVIPAQIIGRSKASEVDVSDDPRFIEAVNQLEDPDEEVSCKAARSLTRFGGLKEPPLTALRQSAEDKTGPIRVCLQKAIDKLE